MTLRERIAAFAELGDVILTKRKDLQPAKGLWDSVSSANQQNAWFTPEFCTLALESIAKHWLSGGTLTGWLSNYPSLSAGVANPKRIGVVMAGNVPLVGFHDLLCVLITGNTCICKVSSKDGGLIQALANALISIEPRFGSMVAFTEDKLSGFDGIIATGSDNSARYFDYYFRNFPSIIRRNRHSIALITGTETREQLGLLANDIFLYFGLGCRSVSKVLVPQGYDFNPLVESMDPFRHLANHHKYSNNYMYSKTLLLMNGLEHIDNGFLILTPSEQLGSPIGVLYYQYYHSFADAADYAARNSDGLQCVVSVSEQIPQAIAPGQSQFPGVSEYADRRDTISFLCSMGG